MSFNDNNDGFNTSSTGGRGEGFTDSRGGVESYGQGTGAGAYDPANTGLGGYGTSQNQQRATADQTMQSGGDNFGSTRADQFDNSNFDSSNRDSSNRVDNFDSNNNSGSNTGAFGRNRDLENPSFGGDDSSFGNTSTGQTFDRSSSGIGSGTGSGVGARDDFNDNNTANAPSRGGLDTFGDDNNNNNNNTSSGARNDQFGGESQREREGGKPTFGDKARGTVEKLAGTVTKNQELKERGQERKTGEF